MRSRLPLGPGLVSRRASIAPLASAGMSMLMGKRGKGWRRSSSSACTLGTCIVADCCWGSDNGCNFRAAGGDLGSVGGQ